MNFINRILGWIDRLIREPRTAPEKPAPVEEVIKQPIWTLDGPESIEVGTALSTGIVRSHNEDSLFTLLGNLVGHEPYPNFGLFLVADGMGGHRAGEIASSISVRTTAHHLTESTILHLFDLEPDDSLPQLQELIRVALEDANQKVADKVPGGGTTLTAAILIKDMVVIGHVGDSRAYIIKNGTSKLITRDHSLVERLRELGQLTPEEAASHPQRNVLYRAIGQGANLEVDTFTHPVPDGGYLLLCSDGLWAEVPEQEIQRIVSIASHPQEACDELVRTANEAGGPDNITAVLVRFPSSE
jgi:serine/threonine protein phosphatase PrpC